MGFLISNNKARFQRFKIQDCDRVMRGTPPILGLSGRIFQLLP